MGISRDKNPDRNVFKLWRSMPTRSVAGKFYLPAKSKDALPDEAEYWDDIKSNTRESGFVRVGRGTLLMLRPDLDMEPDNCKEYDGD